MSSNKEVNTTQEVEILLENATELLRDEDVEVLTQLNNADHIAQDMEQKLDAVLSDLDRLLEQLDSEDTNEPTLGSHEKPKTVKLQPEKTNSCVSSSSPLIKLLLYILCHSRFILHRSNPPSRIGYRVLVVHKDRFLQGPHCLHLILSLS
jgi:hypothetical protein